MSKSFNRGDLRIWHIPQIPGEPFRVAVPSVQAGVELLRVLADYDEFQLDHRIKPDYANAQGLEIYHPDYGWMEWCCSLGMDLGDHQRVGTGDYSLLVWEMDAEG